MTYPLVVIGAGGFGREVLDTVAALSEGRDGPRLVGVVDDAPTTHNLKLLKERHVKFIGSLSSWLETDRFNERFVIAVGNAQAREQIASRISGRWTAATLVHPGAQVGIQNSFAPGVIICAGAILSANVHCGDHTHINPGAIIGHDARLGKYTSVNPGAVLSGNTSLGSRATLGANCTVLQNLSIGIDAVVGAGAVVTKDVDPNTTVIGVPARAVESE